MPSGLNPHLVDKRDPNRVLLTEVLPYEVPLWFTNEFFYDECARHRHEDLSTPLGCLLSIVGKVDRVPYVYWVIRDEGSTRELAVMHPSAQLDVVRFYAKNDELILHFCSRSTQSLRAPNRVVSRFFESTSGNLNTQGVEEDENEKSYCSSYFSYNKHAFLYKFFESYEYHALEKRFRHMHQVDIANCFPSIYTHSVSWAVKSRVFAKKQRRRAAGFDVEFDKLMRRMNYEETNGILVGPEVSRIFAEIILQEVDARLISAMERRGKRLRTHYDFRRFVDDYFVFASDHTDCEAVIAELERILAEYKLHLSKAKHEYLARPFISQLSLCKLDLSQEIDRVLGARYLPGETPRLKDLTRSASRLANSAIVGVKSVLKRHSGMGTGSTVTYKGVSNYFLASYARRMKALLDGFNPSRDKEESIAAYILVDLEVLYFVYSMDLRVRPTDWIARLVQMVVKFADTLRDESQYLVRKKILDLTRHTIEVSLGAHERVSFVEIQNMILVLSLLGEEFLLEESYLSNVLTGFLDREPQQKCSYFMWVTLMLYIRNESRYEDLRRRLVELAVLRFECDDYGIESSELFMFFSDALTCPWVDDGARMRMLEAVSSRHDGFPVTQAKTAALLARFRNQKLFVDWADRDWAAKRLEKKKHAFPYEQ